MQIRHLIAIVVTMALVGAGTLSQRTVVASEATEPQGPRPGAPMFELDKSWPQSLPKGTMGNISSIAVDDKDNVWVLQRPLTLPDAQLSNAVPPIVIFDANGRFVRAWGGPGAGYEWPEREHGITIDPKGFVWIGGNHCAEDNAGVSARLKPVGDDHLLKFTQDGKFLLQIGRSNQSAGNADTRNMRQPADLAMYPATNEIFVADGYGNRRVIVFDADTGAYKRMWGAFSNKPVDNAPCPPVNAAFKAADPGPDQYSTVHSIRVSRDGLVYVADRELRRLQVFTADGKFLRQRVRTSAPFARSLAFSPDPEQKFLYVGGGVDVTILDRNTLEIVDLIGGGGLTGGGHHITTDSKGNIYLAHVGNGMQKLTFKGIAPAK